VKRCDTWCVTPYGLSVDRPENDFERRVRESEESLLRQLPTDKRPVNERWSWFLVVTAWAWFQVALLGADLARAEPVEAFRWFAVAALVVMFPLFLASRKSGLRKRLRAQGNDST